MKICVNRNPILDRPWGGGAQFVNAFWRFAAQDHWITAKLEEDVDLIFVIDPRHEDGCVTMREIAHFKATHPKVKLVQRINECDARKGTHDMDLLLRQCSMLLDKTIFVSEWIRDYHLTKGWHCDADAVIYNGCSFEPCSQEQKYSARNGKVNIVSAHWSDNPMKGQDTTEFLEDFVQRHGDGFTFTFIGRTKANVKQHIKPLFGAALGQELARYDVCINGTRFDPGPNSVIEPICCGLPTYVHCDGGGAVEFAGNDEHVFHSIELLEKLLLQKQFTQNNVRFESWESTIQNYVKYLAENAHTQHRM